MRLLPILALGGAVAAIAYFLHPSQGERRRAAVRDRFARYHVTAVPDDVLEERVRARLARITADPDAITVRANCGAVALRGTVSRRELDGVLAAVLAVRGVTEVTNYLDAGERPSQHAGMQGAAPSGAI